MSESTVNTEFNPMGGGKLSSLKRFSDFKFFKNLFKLSLKPLTKVSNLCKYKEFTDVFKTSCFPEFISESNQHEIIPESIRPQIPKQVRNDIKCTIFVRSFAFTLAETLITIGMIGVIAALTLPTLMNSTNEKEIVARVKKVHATLNEAHGRAVAKYGPVDTWFRTTDSTAAKRSERIGKRFCEFLQVEKDCGLEVSGQCFTSGKTKTITGSEINKDLNSRSDMYKVVLSDGTSVVFHGYAETFSQGCIYFDIDGPKKGRHTNGVDFFNIFILNTNKIGIHFANESDNTPDKCRSGGTILSCTSWILRYDNADYINCEGLTDSNPTCN